MNLTLQQLYPDAIGRLLEACLRVEAEGHVIVGGYKPDYGIGREVRRDEDWKFWRYGSYDGQLEPLGAAVCGTLIHEGMPHRRGDIQPTLDYDILLELKIKDLNWLRGFRMGWIYHPGTKNQLELRLKKYRRYDSKMGRVVEDESVEPFRIRVPTPASEQFYGFEAGQVFGPLWTEYRQHQGIVNWESGLQALWDERCEAMKIGVDSNRVLCDTPV